MEVNIAGLIVECVKLLLVLCGCLNFPVKKKPIAAIMVFSLAQLCLVIKGIQDKEYYVSTFLFLSVVICALAVEGKRKWGLSLIAYLGISCIDTLFCTIIIRVFSVSEEAIFSASVWRVGINAISLLLLVIAAWLLQKFYYQKKNLGERIKREVQKTNGFFLGLLAIGLLAASWFIMPVSYLDFQWDKITEYIIIFMVFTFAIVFLIAGILLVFYHRSSTHYQELAKMNQNLLESRERYYQMLLEKEEETRRFRHDMASHVTCVKQLLREENVQGARAYLDEFGETLEELRLKHQTGNTLVNAIVNDMCAKYPQVTLNWEGFFPAETTLSDMDMCTVFSNLLENAFYAASQCTTESVVDVTVKSVANALSIIIENDRAGVVEEEKGRLFTQKEDKKNHGFGTRNVKDCVAKNGGTVIFEYTETKFRATVTLVNVVLLQSSSN